MLRYARSRQASLDELAELVKAKKNKTFSLRKSGKETKVAHELRKLGLSYGSRTRILYKRFWRSWDVSSVEHAIKRYRAEDG
jgi:hypothetical protein